MELKLTDKEKNIILQALYYYEDNKWFGNKDDVNALIKKFEKSEKLNTENWILCDY
jgi:hypothetical protein